MKKAGQMRAIIDTNIFILSESNTEIQDNIARLSSLSIKHGLQLLIHPASFDDLQRDLDESRKRIQISKLGKYPILEGDISPDITFTKIIGASSRFQNDIDNRILFSVYKNNVNFLITEDMGIHRKARKLGLSDRVLTISQAIKYIEGQYERSIPSHILLEHIPIHQLDLKSNFFDSLRGDYKDFNKWFIEKEQEGRMCWCWRDDRKMNALLIYAEKNKKILRDYKEKVLKICTFKVSENARGLKVGELLLKMAFEYSIKNDIKTIYVTIYPKKVYLTILLEDFGFEKIDEKPDREFVYAKDFLAPPTLINLSPLDYCKQYYPNFYDGAKVKKFIVPIKPEYHDRLFSDVSFRQTFVDEYANMVIEQNTIKKAYICNSKITKIEEGDILLFYRSQKNQAVTGIGIVESTKRHPSSFDDLVAFIGPRSVYTNDELKILFESGALAILFRYIGQFPIQVPREMLIKNNIVKSPPQSIVTIDDISYDKIRSVSRDG
jgi:ribosomal protein S18 acetylase RimI-like enzyme